MTEEEKNKNKMKEELHAKAVANSRDFGFDKSGVLTDRRKGLEIIFEEAFTKFQEIEGSED